MANAALGLFLLEKSWANLERHRDKAYRELNDLFPAFRRVDSQYWQKWTMYPGAMLLLIPRILFGILMLILIIIFVNLLLIGHDRSQPLTGLRKILLNVVFYVFLRLMCVFS
jgi:hypothetical protein